VAKTGRQRPQGCHPLQSLEVALLGGEFF
jgi:hypothetical protein